MSETLLPGSKPGRRERGNFAQLLPRISVAVTLIVVTGWFGREAWERRWIADDGLIVLRTVRNLLAGNGPVFNAGERVEVNTSALWTYVVWFFSWATGGRLEYVSLWAALVCSILAVALVIVASPLLYRRLARAHGARLYLPAGILLYVVLPPARDFATSGLENGMVLLWISLAWALALVWARRTPGFEDTGRGWWLMTATAFVGGLGWLVRPEMVVLSALLVVWMVLSVATWGHRWSVAVAALALPVLYQVWRMSYYGLPYPNTAAAKSASDTEWGQGWNYFYDTFSTYRLAIPLLLLVVFLGIIAVITGWSRTGARGAEGWPETERLAMGELLAELGRDAGDAGESEPGPAWRRSLRQPAAVAGIFVATGLFILVYVIRVGGDFMHGRMLLTPIFLMLLPIAVVPVLVRPVRERALAGLGAVAVLTSWALLLTWAVDTGRRHELTEITETSANGFGIVDERGFYSYETGVLRPLTVDDYRTFMRVPGLLRTWERHPDGGGLFLPGGKEDDWYYIPSAVGTPPEAQVRMTYFINLGMLGMLLPLETKVYDSMGLAFPLAAHSERIENGRIGHDKNLIPDWVVALGGFSTRQEDLAWLYRDWVVRAQSALECGDVQDFLRSYRGPLTPAQRWENLTSAFSNAAFEFSNIPEKVLERCGLPNPIPTSGE